MALRQRVDRQRVVRDGRFEHGARGDRGDRGDRVGVLLIGRRRPLRQFPSPEPPGLSDTGPVRTAAAASASLNRARRVSTSPWSSCTCLSSAFVPGAWRRRRAGRRVPARYAQTPQPLEPLRSMLDLNLRCSCCNARNARSCSPSVASSSSCSRLHRASSAAIFSTCASVGRTALTSATDCGFLAKPASKTADAVTSVPGSIPPAPGAKPRPRS